jgi:hypothetical protein
MSEKHFRELIFEQIGYKPTGIQNKIHDSDVRIKLVAGGERGGKSVVGSKEAVLRIPRSELIWIVGAEYDISRTEFEYILEDCQKLKLITDPNKNISFPKQGECSFTAYNKCRVVTKSAKEPQKLGMQAPDFILGCESAQMEYEAYLRLRGRLAEKRAPMVLTGTFEGSLGWYADMYTLWQSSNNDDAKSFSLPSWANDAIYKQCPHPVIPDSDKCPVCGLPLIITSNGEKFYVDEEIYKLWTGSPYDMANERYAGVPCKPSGLIMSEFSNVIHVGDYSYDPEIPVEIAVDPGYGFPGAYAVVVVQVKEGAIYLVDEIYLQGYVTEDIITICKQKEWWGKLQGGAIDIAGRQHQAMPAPVEVWQNIGGLYLNSRKVDVEGGIDVLRTFLTVNPVTNRPKLFVNHTCRGFIAECGGGKSPVFGGGSWLRDVNTGKIIDRNNHSTKAVTYWLVNRYGYTPRTAETNYGKTFGPGLRR